MKTMIGKICVLTVHDLKESNHAKIIVFHVQFWYFSIKFSYDLDALTFPVCKGDFVGHKEVDRHHKIW